MSRHIAKLMAMHTYCRPDGSHAENLFIDRFIRPVGVAEDLCGNLWKVVGAAPPTVLWSCHTDTVHTKSGRQQVAHDRGKLYVAGKQWWRKDCLGADDTAGVWIMLEMIHARIPGLYVFHRGEEVGCIGSKHFLSAHKAGRNDLLKGIKAAIAFDRRGTTDIVTHQFGGRTASDAFAKSLAAALGMKKLTPAYGAFTDTATYADIIPECTNVSVGYEMAHSPSENLDVRYLIRLRDAVVKIDTSKLVIARDPSVKEVPSWMTNHGSAGHNSYGTPLLVPPKSKIVPFTGSAINDPSPDHRLQTVLDWVKAYPDEIADYLEQAGVNAWELRDYIDQSRGMALQETYTGLG
jgi:hypothetical protein